MRRDAQFEPVHLCERVGRKKHQNPQDQDQFDSQRYLHNGRWIPRGAEQNLGRYFLKRFRGFDAGRPPLSPKRSPIRRANFAIRSLLPV